MNEAALIKLLRRECSKVGSQRAYAELHGISHSYLRRVLCGDRAPPDALLNSLKLKRVVLYRKDTP